MTRRATRTAVVLAVALAANAAVALAAVHSPLLAVLAVVGPAAFAALVAITASDRSILFFAALALPISLPVLNQSFSIGAIKLFPSDLVVVLAVAAWVAGRFAASDGRPKPRAPVLPFPRVFALFAVVVIVDTLRGHAAYGASIVGEPLRLAAYVLIGLTLSDLPAEKALRGLRAVFYTGAFWSLATAAFYLATGRSQTTSDELSTGGTRVLALSVSLELAIALFLALLSFELPRTHRQRILDTSVAAAALVGIVLAFGRGTFIAVAVVAPLLVATAPRLRARIVGWLPLLVPVFVVSAALTAVLAPGTWKTLEQRVQIGAATSDPSVEWRKEATHVIWQQVRSSPFVGVGFGKGGEFDLNGTHYTITQDPHDSFVLLAAGGGALLVTLFVAMIALFLRDAVRRRRVGTPTERVLVVWSVGVAVSYLLNAFAGPLLSTPGELLIIWSAFLLPMVTTRPATAEAPVERAPAQRSPLATARRGSARPGAAATAPR